MKIFKAAIFLVLFSIGGCVSSVKQDYDELSVRLVNNINERNLSHSVFDTPVTIKMKNVTISQFFKQVLKTVPISVVMQPHAAATVISVSAKNEPLRSVLIRIGAEYSLIFFLDEEIGRFEVFKVESEKLIFVKDI